MFPGERDEVVSGWHVAIEDSIRARSALGGPALARVHGAHRRPDRGILEILRRGDANVAASATRVISGPQGPR
jgi:hypothetical protein